jgi:hypothetical protein
MGDPRMDARMQQTYAQNIEANRQQQIANQIARFGTQVGGQTALMRSGARGLYSPVDILKTGTTPERAAKILEEGFRGGTVPTYAGKGKAFVGDPNVAKMYGDEILDVVTPAGGIRTIGGGIGKKGLAIGEEVALDPKTATKGLSLAQRLKAGAYPSSPTAQRLLQTGTTAAKPIAKFAGRAIPGIGAGLAVMDVEERLSRDDPDYIGAALGAGSALPLVGIPFLGAQVVYDQLRDPDARTTEEIARASQYGDAAATPTPYESLLSRLDQQDIDSFVSGESFDEAQARQKQQQMDTRQKINQEFQDYLDKQGYQKYLSDREIYQSAPAIMERENKLKEELNRLAALDTDVAEDFGFANILNDPNYRKEITGYTGPDMMTPVYRNLSPEALQEKLSGSLENIFNQYGIFNNQFRKDPLTSGQYLTLRNQLEDLKKYGNVDPKYSERIDYIMPESFSNIEDIRRRLDPNRARFDTSDPSKQLDYGDIEFKQGYGLSLPSEFYKDILDKSQGLPSQYQGYAKNLLKELQNMNQGGRVGFQAGSTEEMIKAQEAAAQDPELDRIRQQLFGEGYVQDIGEGKGIAQYYSGFGLPQSLAFTPAPVEEVAPVADVIEPVVETGGGGGGIGDVDITTPDVGDAPINVDTPLTQMITTPTGDTMTVKEAMTSDDAYSLDTPSFDDQFQDIEDIQQTYGTPIDIGFGKGQVDPGLAAGLEGPIVDTSPVTPTITAPSGDVFAVDDPLAEEKIDFTPETQGLIDQAFSKVGSTASDIMNDLSQIPGAVADFANQTVDIAGQKINVGSTLLKAGINKIVGGPISLVLDAIGALGIKGGRGDVSDSLAEKYGRDDIGRLTTGVMAGYSVGPNFAQTIQDRIDNIKNRKAPQTDASRKTIEELETIKAETIAAGSSGVITEPGTVLGPAEFLPEGEDLVTAEELAAEERKEGLEELSDIYSGIGQTRDAPSPTPQEIPDRGRGDGRDTGPTESPQGSGDPYGGGEGGVQSGLGSPDVGEVSSDAGFSEPSNQDGGGGGGGGKIVCTMMNESYGFGSFRNKIWLRQSKNLAPEYQIGYHKIFLPLVRLSKTNKLLKKTLEHIAVHRTIDIRQEARGKVHLLGRVYRKVLEPICYWVGKHAKR